MKKNILSLIFFAGLSLLLNSSIALASPIKDLFASATKAYAKGDYDNAIKDYEKCLELYPKFPQVYYYLGLVNKDKGTDKKEVIKLFKKAVEFDPKYWEAYDNLAKIYYEIGSFDDALENGLKAVEINPDSVKTHLTLGWIYLLGKSEPYKAISHFEIAVKDHKIAYGYFGLGLAYFMDNQRTRVLEMITALRQIEQEDLAVKLESMVRSNQYIKPDELGPLLRPPKKEEMKDFFEDEDSLFMNEAYSFENTDGMKVRLKEEETIEPISKEHMPMQIPLTGAERIEALKKRGASF